jgi:hypothetical protein
VATCAHHPDTAAAWRCGFCARELCGQCVGKRTVKEHAVQVCRECGGRCEPLASAPAADGAPPAAPPAATPAATPASGSLLDDLRPALAFPLRAVESRVDLVVTVGFLLVGGVAIEWAQRIGVGVAGALLVLAVALLLAGALAGYLVRIVETTAAGSDEAPGWPELSPSFWEPITFSLPAILLCHGPAIVWTALGGGSVVYWLLWAAASAVVPMCLLANVLTRSWWGLHPARLVASIARAPGDYAVVVLGWNVIGWLDGLIGQLLQAWLPFGTLLRLLLLAYTLTVQMRLLGRFYRRNEERMAWF